MTNIEAKCAGVRDELGQMAMSEQYMRTKQAQLLAKRKEKEAEKALEAASMKELEAQVDYCYCINICLVVHTDIKFDGQDKTN